jgi:RHS repeat-associated protein
MHGTELKLNTATQQVSGTRIVDVGGASAVRTSDGKITMVIEDHQGTGQWAVDKATLAATQRKLGAFGAERVSPATPWPADKGFVGGTQDASTGLVHLGAREYDPTTGAFISADPLMDLQDPEHMNGYAYSKHSPVTYSDASGLAPLGPTDDSTMGYTYDPDDKRMEPDAEKVNYNSNGTTGAGTSKAGTSKPRSSAASTSSGGSSRSEAEVRRAVEIKKRSVVDIIKEAGAQIVLEVLGINDIRDCFGSGNVGSCISMAVGFLPWGKILKAKRIGEALFRAFRGFVRHQRDMRWADDVLGGAACAVNSFTPDTRVVLASGRTKAIDEVSLGDEVLAEDPTTGERQARPVEAVIRGDGEKQLVQITVAAPDDPGAGKSVVATEGHPIWVEGPGEWREAGKIAVGDLLRTGAGTFVQVTAVRHFAQKQVVYNLTVSGLHTYFVQVGNSSVLTHNCGDPAKAGTKLGWSTGDDIYTLTRAGNKPAWSTVRGRYWKNEAANPQIDSWSDSNLDRMRRGLAPQRHNRDKGGTESMELSHEPIPYRDGGTAVIPRWPQDHAAVDPYRFPGY